MEAPEDGFDEAAGGCKAFPLVVGDGDNALCELTVPLSIAVNQSGDSTVSISITEPTSVTVTSLFSHVKEQFAVSTHTSGSW